MNKNTTRESFIERLQHIDRRIIFLLIALAVIIPMMLDLDFKVFPSPVVEGIFDKIESLPAGSKILVSYDFGPSTVPENEPMGDAILYQCMKKRHKVYLMALWPTGEAEANKAIERVIKGEFPDRVYGEDYIQLGFKAGNQGLINAIFTDLKGMYTTDANGVDISSFPMMSDVTRLMDFAFILGVCSGKPGMKEWIQFAGDRGDIPVAGGVTAVEAPLLYPYYPSQLLGLMGGMQGAAELQAAVMQKYPEYYDYLRRKMGATNAVRNMGPQTIAHLVIIFFVILGNIAFFVQQRRKKQARRD